MIAKLYRQIPKLYIYLIAGDFVILTVLITTVVAIKNFGILYTPHKIAIGLSVMVYIFVFYILGLYSLEQRFRSIFYLSLLLTASFLSAFIVAGSFYFIFTWKLSRLSFFINVPLVVAAIFLWRLVFLKLFKYAQRAKKVLIVGAGRAGRIIYSIIKKNPEFNVAGFIDDDPHKANKATGPLPVMGDCSRLFAIAEKNNIDMVIVAIKTKKNKDLYGNMLKCKMAGITLTDMASVYEEATGRVPIEYVGDSWFISSPILGVKKNIYNLRIKRMLDVAVSLCGLIMCLPIVLLVMPLIRLDSSGPVFFRQRRVGMNEKPFYIYKFRSMKEGTEGDRRLAGKKNDPRITRVGRIIRLARIDEIPQMWNVLKGEISFIGPRALMEEEVREFEARIPYFSLRHSVRPGITGWAQVNYPHGVSERDAAKKLQYDLYYIINASLFLDLFILIKTVRIVLFGIGSK